MIKRKLTQEVVAREPWQVWNSFIDLLAMEDYKDLTPLQRIAHLVFWYESEVQNGGHGQYFDNQGTAHVSETIAALEQLGAGCQGKILKDAFIRYQDDPDDFSETDFDTAFHACQPSLQLVLEECLEKYVDEFIEIR